MTPPTKKQTEKPQYNPKENPLANFKRAYEQGHSSAIKKVLEIIDRLDYRDKKFYIDVEELIKEIQALQTK